MSTVTIEYHTERGTISVRSPQGGYIILTPDTLLKVSAAMRQALVEDSVQKALQLPPDLATRVRDAALALIGDTERQRSNEDE